MNYEMKILRLVLAPTVKPALPSKFNRCLNYYVYLIISKLEKHTLRIDKTELICCTLTGTHWVSLLSRLELISV